MGNKRGRFLIVTLLSLLTCLSLVGEEIPAEEELQRLEELRAKGIISEEKYEFLHSVLTELEQGQFYSLYVNGKKIHDAFKVDFENGKCYLAATAFFDLLDHTPLEWTNKRVVLPLEHDQDIVTINIGKNVKDRHGKKIKLIEGENFIQDDNGEEIYLEENLFKDLFLKSLQRDDQALTLRVVPAFTTKDNQFMDLDISEDKLNDEADYREVVHTNSRKLWELGYLRTDLNWGKSSGSSSTWNNQLEYQGSFLYGTLITGVDLDDGEWNDTSLRYRDIWKQHDLEIWRYSNNEKGISFKRKKGYYWNGNRYVITEDVPIGCTVELIYMGAVIAIQKAENGEVTFANDEIIENRTYTLKIYTPSGEILYRSLKTQRDYNQQKKGQVEYNLDIREKNYANKYKTNLEVYYGLTDRITLGAEYMKAPEQISNTGPKEWRSLEEAHLELIFSDRIMDFPYVVSAGYGKAFNLYNNKTSYDIMGEIDIRDWTVSVGFEKFGHYYQEKTTRDVEVTYNFSRYITVGYDYLYQEKYNNTKTTDHRVEFSLSLPYKRLLTTLNFNRSTLNQKNEFDLNFYYTGIEGYSLMFSNSWENSIDNYEAKFIISNNQYYGPIDASLEIRYSEKEKSTLTAKFEVKFDDWFKITTSTSRHGDNSIAVGIDKTFDLRDLKRPVESMDTSRLKVITFYDKNENNCLDADEELLEDVMEKVGSQKGATDQNGEIYFYGVPNNIRYELELDSPRPSHTVGKIKYSVLGKDTSTIEAFIPIISYTNVTGNVQIDPNLPLDLEEDESIYSDIVVELRNLKGKVLEKVSPDESGEFAFSGLFDKEYIVTINYRGELFEVPSFSYLMNADGEPVNFIFDGKSIKEDV